MLKTKNSFSIMLLTSTLLLVSACTNKPREVSAKVSLVSYSTEKPNKKIIPDQYWNALGDANASAFAHPKYSVFMGPIYVSALGDHCRRLELIDKNRKMKKRIACELHFIDENNQQNKAWFLEKEIIESTRYDEL